MFETRRGIFSVDYCKELQYKDRVRSLSLEAVDSLKGCKLYGREINVNNPEEVIAVLFILYKDKEHFHEGWN